MIPVTSVAARASCWAVRDAGVIQVYNAGEFGGVWTLYVRVETSDIGGGALM